MRSLFRPCADLDESARMLASPTNRIKHNAFGQTTWRLAGVTALHPAPLNPPRGEAPRKQGPERILPDLEKPVLRPKGQGAEAMAVNSSGIVVMADLDTTEPPAERLR